MSPPFISVAYSTGGTVEFVTASVQSSNVNDGQAGISHTHTLDSGAIAGDHILWLAGMDGLGGFTLPSGLTQIGTYGVFRHVSYLYDYTITSGDITTGSVARTFTLDPVDDENMQVMSVEVKNLGTTNLPVQESKNTSSSNVTSVSGETLTGVVAGNVLLGLCIATPDGGTNGLEVSNLNSFTDLGVTPAFVPTGGVMLHMSFIEATAGGSYTGPSYTNDSTTGPGNVTNPAVLELESA